MGMGYVYRCENCECEHEIYGPFGEGMASFVREVRCSTCNEFVAFSEEKFEAMNLDFAAKNLRWAFDYEEWAKSSTPQEIAKACYKTPQECYDWILAQWRQEAEGDESEKNPGSGVFKTQNRETDVWRDERREMRKKTLENRIAWLERIFQDEASRCRDENCDDRDETEEDDARKSAWDCSDWARLVVKYGKCPRCGGCEFEEIGERERAEVGKANGGSDDEALDSAYPFLICPECGGKMTEVGEIMWD